MYLSLGSPLLATWINNKGTSSHTFFPITMPFLLLVHLTFWRWLFKLTSLLEYVSGPNFVGNFKKRMLRYRAPRDSMQSLWCGRENPRPQAPPSTWLLQSHADMAENHRLGQGDSSSDGGPSAADGFPEPILIHLNCPSDTQLGLPFKKLICRKWPVF